MLLRMLISCGAAVLMALAAPGARSAEPASTGDVRSVISAAQTIESKLAQARSNLALVEASGDGALTNAPAGISQQDLVKRRALHSRLVRLLEQQLSNITELENVKNQRLEITRKAQAWTRFAEPPPYSVVLADRLREELQSEQFKSTSGQAAVSAIDQLIEENRKELTQTEERLRQLHESLEAAKDAVSGPRLSWQKDLERLSSQVAAATLGVLDAERQFRQEALEESRIRVALLGRQLVIAEANTRFTQADLDQIAGRIENDQVLLEKEFAVATERGTTAVQAANLAREELGKAQATKNIDRAVLARLSEALAAREAELETVQASIRILRFMLEGENTERAMWELRFAAYENRRADALSESERRLKTFTRRFRLWKDYVQQQMDVMPAQIDLQETRVQTLGPDSELLPHARQRLAALRERDQLLERLARRVDRLQRLSQRWQEGLRAAEKQLPFAGKVENVFSSTGSFVQKLWDFELFTAEDTITVDGQKITGKRSITLGKIVLALLILVVGVWVTGVVSRVLQPIIVRRLKIEVNQANLIRRWFRAFLIVCLAMFSLISVKIPLTVFAFAGGALAIGLGFGTQNLLKNFVSGLILLFERPFRVGDVLEVAGNRGRVTEIGLRASVLELWDGTETLIPNSSLLENQVSNWTYSSRKVRFTVSVGAAYGSDSRRVLHLLAETAERHGLVEKDPKPQVLFTDFGESALIFELRYWVDVINANAAQIASDLRLMISTAFAENGIVIAYPQRDLHLEVTRPVPVEIVPNQGANKSDGANHDLADSPQRSEKQTLETPLGGSGTG